MISTAGADFKEITDFLSIQMTVLRSIGTVSDTRMIRRNPAQVHAPENHWVNVRLHYNGHSYKHFINQTWTIMLVGVIYIHQLIHLS